MSALVVGLSHRTAPVAMLEAASVGPDDMRAVLDALCGGAFVHEAAVISTCNRIEVVAAVDKFHGSVAEVSELLARRVGVDVAELGGHLFVHYEDAAVQHLFDVVAGLDSMVIGEAQILGQLRATYAVAREHGSAGRELHDLLQQTLRVGKRVHADTGIDRVGASLVGVGLQVAAQPWPDGLLGRRALLIGAGSLGALTGATLRRAGAVDLVVANRTVQTAQRLAASLEGTAIGLDDVEEYLTAVDLVVSGTGATGLVLPADVVARAQKVREGRPLTILDLALPHDVDPAVREIEGVRLIDLDALAGAYEGEEVESEVAAARGIVADEVGAYLARQRSERVGPTVVALRSRADEVVAAELFRLDSRAPQLDASARVEVESAIRRVVSTLLHAPTVRVKELAEAPGGASYADALRELFCLDPKAADSVSRAGVAVDSVEPQSPPEVRDE